MSQMIFVNLPVENLAASIAFYKAIGAEQNLKFSDETAAMMSLSETIHVMLLTHGKYREFTSKQIADARQTSEVMLCLSAGNRAAVDTMVVTAKAAKGNPDPNPKQDFGFMYGRSFEDPDGHIWEVMWMDPAAAERGPAAFAADAG